MVDAINIQDFPELQDLQNSKQSYTIDYGGSLIKMLYKEKTKFPGKRADLKLAILPNNDVNKLAAFIEQNVEPGSNEEIYTTGFGFSKYSKDMEEMIKKRINNQTEFDCFTKALRLILTQIAPHQLFYPLPKEEFLKGYRVANGFLMMERELNKETTDHQFVVFPHDDFDQYSSLPLPDVEVLYNTYGDGDILPAIIVMCSSGFALFKYVDHNTGTQSIDYSPRGGRTLMGLGTALTGAKTFNELMELAAKGTSANIDTYVADLKAPYNNDFYHLFPDESYCFGFGKAAGKHKDELLVEDLAISAVMYVCSDVSQIALNHALSKKIKNIILCGTLITHPVVQKAITFCFLSRSLGYPVEIQPRLRICTMGPYLGAVGAWISGMEQEKTNDMDT